MSGYLFVGVYKVCLGFRSYWFVYYTQRYCPETIKPLDTKISSNIIPSWASMFCFFLVIKFSTWKLKSKSKRKIHSLCKRPQKTLLLGRWKSLAQVFGPQAVLAEGALIENFNPSGGSQSQARRKGVAVCVEISCRHPAGACEKVHFSPKKQENCNFQVFGWGEGVKWVSLSLFT